MKTIVTIKILILSLFSSALFAQDVKTEIVDDEEVIKEGPDIQSADLQNLRSSAPLGYETIDPSITIWDQTPWSDEQINFRPGGRSLPAGDLTGDGEMDLYRIYTDVPDERDGQIDTYTDKTLLFWGIESGTEPDLIIYEEIIPVGDINGDGYSNALFLDEESQEWYIYKFTKDEYTREVWEFDEFSNKFSSISLNKIAHHDLNNSGFEDLIILENDILYIVYGGESVPEKTIESYQISDWAREYDLEFSRSELKDLYWYEDDPHIIIATIGNMDGRNSFILAFDDEDRLKVKQQLNHSDENTHSGILQAHHLSKDEEPYLVWIWSYEDKIKIIPPSDDQEKLFKSEVIEWADQEMFPVGDLDGTGTTNFVYYDDNGRLMITQSEEDPFHGPKVGQVLYQSDDLKINFNDIALLYHDYGDLSGNDQNDLLLDYATDTDFGQQLIEGDVDRNFETTGILYDHADFERIVREFTYNLGDITGNGYDEVAINVNYRDHAEVKIYEGGGDFSTPLEVIETSFSSVQEVISGNFTDTDYKDIVIQGRQSEEVDGESLLRSEIRFYETEGSIATSEFHVIKDEDAYVNAEDYNNVLGLITNAGDVNNTGYDDLLISAPNRTDVDGEYLPVLLYYGGKDLNSISDHEIDYYKPDRGSDGPGFFGYGNTLHALGDFSGNGIDDFAIANTNEQLNDEGNLQGAVHIFFGQDGNEETVSFEEADITLMPNEEDPDEGINRTRLAASEIAIGDFNGSGYNDIAVASGFSRSSDDRSMGHPGIHIYNGGPDMDGQPDHMVGLLSEIMSITDAESKYMTLNYHAMMHAIPDVNDSGHDELLVIAGNNATNAVLLEGSDDSLVEEPLSVFKAPNQSVDMGVPGNFINRHYKSTVGNFTSSYHPDFFVTQRDDANYRDTPVYQYHIDDVSAATMDKPDQVTLAEPAEDEAVEADSLIFTWIEAEPAVDEYEFQLTSDDEFDDMVVDSVLTDTSIVVHDLDQDGEYTWRVRASNAEGWGEHSPARTLDWTYTHIAGTEGVPDEFALNENYPNPFNPTTQIQYDIPEVSHVRLEVYDVLGRRVSTLVDEQQQPGRYEVSFDASNLSSGTYIYRIEAGDFVETRQMMFVK